MRAGSSARGGRKRQQAAHLYLKRHLLDITLALAPESDRGASSPRPSPPEEEREKVRGIRVRSGWAALSGTLGIRKRQQAEQAARTSAFARLRRDRPNASRGRLPRRIPTGRHFD
ncbi:hypothetical protein SBV1_2600003 [Verrucomicrobia bacterium]|nr:hypothetical protein SBV1_2600003 [Verrucomicrobiota bacterium]